MRMILLALTLLTIACTGPGEGTADVADSPTPDGVGVGVDQAHPDVLSAELTAAEDGTWSLSATISSPYDTPERYADAFRALTVDGTELGVRELTHDHADEQPFTRTLTDLRIPEGATQITVEGRDLTNGWGGETVTLQVPR